MKQYILDSIKNGLEVVLYFEKEHHRTFDTIVNEFEYDGNLIELKQRRYSVTFLINLSHVQYVRVVKPLK